MVKEMKRVTATLFILIFCSLFIKNAFAQDTNSYEPIESYVKKRMTEHHIPGMGGAIVKDTSITWMETYGYADIRKKRPMDVQSLMNIGSVSKTFTAAAIMQLWERDLVQLNADINKYLSVPIRNPNHPDTPITIQQLLTHTSSIRDGSTYQNSYTCGDPEISLKKWITQYVRPGGDFYDPKENFSQKKPGEEMSYSNVGFGILGLIVEEVTGQTFSRYTKEHIFAPLGMNDTGWFLHEINTESHVTPTIFVTNDIRKMIENRIGSLLPPLKEAEDGYYAGTCLYSFPNYPDGLVRTSVRDLSKFLIAMINKGAYRGTRILKKETVNKMLTPQLGNKEKQGLGWYHAGFESVWGHGGDDPGIQAGLYFNPELEIGMITFQNSNEGSRIEFVKTLYSTAKNNN